MDADLIIAGTWEHRMIRCIAPALTRMGVLTAHPAAFAIVLCYVVAWLVFSFDTLDWHAVATEHRFEERRSNS
jgi:hypothetical protein